MKKIEQKREDEKRILSEMINLYCRRHHKTGDKLCLACQELENYALGRIDQCPFMETKTFCSACKVHCYRQEMRDGIRIIMKWAGPRMLFYHPKLAIDHMLMMRKERK